MTHARLSRLVGKPAAMAKGHVMPSAPSSSAFSPLSSHPCPCMSTTAREACPCMSTTASGTTTSPCRCTNWRHGNACAATLLILSTLSRTRNTMEDEEEGLLSEYCRRDASRANTGRHPEPADIQSHQMLDLHV